jgi:hypothetical protein
VTAGGPLGNRRTEPVPSRDGLRGWVHLTQEEEWAVIAVYEQALELHGADPAKAARVAVDEFQRMRRSSSAAALALAVVGVLMAHLKASKTPRQ